MRSHRHWLTSGLFGLALAGSSVLLVPSGASAQNEVTTTIIAEATTDGSAGVDQTLPELAPGESPGGIDLESGPVLTLPAPEPSPATSNVEPAGPVVFDPVGSSRFADNTTTVMFFLILTAVPSLTVGTALWIHRDQALSRRP